ncbi:MAG: hypothetical protein ACK4S0_09210 [Sediminibacterium sp.]
MNRRAIYIAFIVIILSAGCGPKTEKMMGIRNRIVHVQDRIIDIETDFIIANPLLYIMDDVLIVLDMNPNTDKGIHLFDKTSFKHLTSTGKLGDGPGEIIRYGRIGIDEAKRIFWVPDHGKQRLMKFPLDSVLNNPEFKPSESLPLLNNTDLFLERFDFLDDSIAIGKAVNVLSPSSYQMVMARQNMLTNQIQQFGYEHPEARGRKSNSFFALSIDHAVYANCYYYCDLITINNLDGSLKCNVYGPDKMENKNFLKVYYTGIDTYNKYFVASYINDDAIIINQFQQQQGNLPSKLLFLDFEGTYLLTYDTGNKFSSFCVDKANNRIIAAFVDRPNPLGYFKIHLVKDSS